MGKDELVQGDDKEMFAHTFVVRRGEQVIQFTPQDWSRVVDAVRSSMETEYQRWKERLFDNLMMLNFSFLVDEGEAVEFADLLRMVVHEIETRGTSHPSNCYKFQWGDLKRLQGLISFLQGGYCRIGWEMPGGACVEGHVPTDDELSLHEFEKDNRDLKHSLSSFVSVVPAVGEYVVMNRIDWSLLFGMALTLGWCSDEPNSTAKMRPNALPQYFNEREARRLGEVLGPYVQSHGSNSDKKVLEMLRRGAVVADQIPYLVFVRSARDAFKKKLSEGACI